MFRSTFAAAVVLPCAILAAPIPKNAGNAQVDLKDHINIKLDTNLHSERYPNNNLKSLPTGRQKLGGVTFEIGDGVLQLGSSAVADKPEKFANIKVHGTAAKLHFLQAAGYNANENEVVAKYVVHYEDKSKEEVEVVYGKHVVDWWAYPNAKAPTDAKDVWEGENEASKGFMAKVKLYDMVWKNPHPEKVILSLDYVAANVEQQCAPFCVAITLEPAADPAKDGK